MSIRGLAEGHGGPAAALGRPAFPPTRIVLGTSDRRDPRRSLRLRTGAAYGVEVQREDGTEVEISLDENFTVVDEEVDHNDRDDDGPDERDND